MLQISQENTCVEFSLLKRNSDLDVFLSSLRRQPYQFPLTLEFLLQFLGIIDTLNILAQFGKFYRETPVPEISMEKIRTYSQQVCNFTEKQTPPHVHSCDFCESFQNSFCRIPPGNCFRVQLCSYKSGYFHQN